MVADTGPAIELTSCRTNSLIDPDELICGFTSSEMPTFSRWIVWNALLRFAEDSDSACPVVIGISCPTSRCACWLSSVIRCGVWSRLDAVSLFTALTIAPRIVPPTLPAPPMNPPLVPRIELSADWASVSLIVLFGAGGHGACPSIVVVVVFSARAPIAPAIVSRLGTAFA